MTVEGLAKFNKIWPLALDAIGLLAIKNQVISLRPHRRSLRFQEVGGQFTT
jgi:hypothetical protein